VREVVSGWQKIAKVQDVEAGEIQQIAWAISHADALR